MIQVIIYIYYYFICVYIYIVIIIIIIIIIVLHLIPCTQKIKAHPMLDIYKIIFSLVAARWNNNKARDNNNNKHS